MLRYLFPAMLAFAPAVSVTAQTTPAAVAPATVISTGAYLKTVDGKRAGQIFSVDKAADGTITGAAVIGNNSALVHIPVDTITAVDKNHFTTSLTYKQIFR